MKKARIQRAVAIASIAIAGTVFSLPASAHASTATSTSATSEVHRYGGYPDQGNCVYWYYAVKATGAYMRRTCYYDSMWLPVGSWVFETGG